MGESHSKGEHRYHPVVPAGTDRSAMARASDGLPFRPYVYGGGKEPPAVTAARQRHLAVNAEIGRRCEQLAAGQDPAAPPEPEPGRAQVPVAPCMERDDGGELAGPGAARDRYQAVQAVQAVLDVPPEPGRPPAPPAATAPARCRRCKYLTTSAGHRVTCDD